MTLRANNNATAETVARMTWAHHESHSVRLRTLDVFKTSAGDGGDGTGKATSSSSLEAKIQRRDGDSLYV